jgi:hypothetical protein
VLQQWAISSQAIENLSMEGSTTRARARTLQVYNGSGNGKDPY